MKTSVTLLYIYLAIMFAIIITEIKKTIETLLYIYWAIPFAIIITVIKKTIIIIVLFYTFIEQISLWSLYQQ